MQKPYSKLRTTSGGTISDDHGVAGFIEGEETRKRVHGLIQRRAQAHKSSPGLPILSAQRWKPVKLCAVAPASAALSLSLAEGRAARDAASHQTAKE